MQTSSPKDLWRVLLRNQGLFSFYIQKHFSICQIFPLVPSTGKDISIKFVTRIGLKCGHGKLELKLWERVNGNKVGMIMKTEIGLKLGNNGI